jgi:hypothetical protein
MRGVAPTNRPRTGLGCVVRRQHLGRSRRHVRNNGRHSAARDGTRAALEDLKTPRLASPPPRQVEGHHGGERGRTREQRRRRVRRSSGRHLHRRRGGASAQVAKTAPVRASAKESGSAARLRSLASVVPRPQRREREWRLLRQRLATGTSLACREQNANLFFRKDRNLDRGKQWGFMYRICISLTSPSA